MLHHVTTSSHQILRQNQVYLHTGLEQWADKLKNVSYATSGLDGALTAILPIKELGKYAERLSPSWCITSHAAETGKAEGIFKYFIDKMLDGGDVQTLWEYGPKGYYYNVKDDGSFEFLGTKSNPKTKYC